MKQGLTVLGLGVALGVAAYIPASSVQAPFWPPFMPAPAPVRVMFGGDIMLDRNVAVTAEAHGASSLFADIADAFTDSDVRVANLEGTVTTNHSIAQEDHSILRFTFDPRITGEALAPLKLSALSMANNHALDFDVAGYFETRARIKAIGIQPFGHPLNLPGVLSTSVVYDGKKLCFVGYHALFAPATSTVVDEIQALRPDCWRVVVMAHWGVEYEHSATTTQRLAAHAFIDAGADLVVGAHPHVVQGYETYRGKAIFYSLGNFMFDQNFSWGTTHGMLLRADFSEEKTRFAVIPTVIQGQRVSLAQGDDRQKVLDIAGVAEFSLP